MAGAGSEQRELLALMHQHLVQLGYERAAKELLEQSGQKTFPSCPVPLREIFSQWKKTASRTLKQKAANTKGGLSAKIRVPDPRSSSESSEEEETPTTTKTILTVNNSTKLKKKATEEESSEDSDSSSEEEVNARKNVKNPMAGNKTDFLQLAGQKTNSTLGKVEAVAALQPGRQQSKPASNKPMPPATTKISPNKGIANKVGASSQSLASGEQKTAQTTLTRATGSSESSSSSTSESEEGKTLNVIKTSASKPELKKAESMSDESSDDSDSEEGSKAATVQLKSSGMNPQAFTKPLKNAVSSLPLNKTASASPLSKPTLKPSVTSFAKAPPPSKEAESRESSSENETMPVPVSQKRLQTPQPSVPSRQNQTSKPRALPKAGTGALKGKKAQMTSSSSGSSDTEEENVPSSCKVPAPSATKAGSAVQPASTVKLQTPQGSLQKAQQSEDSSEDSSDDSDSERDTVLTQKPTQVTHKAAPSPVKFPAARGAGIKSGKPGNAQPAGKGVVAPTKSRAVSLPKASESSETDSSDSSQSKEAEKPAKQPPIHSFFKQVAAIRSGKSLQTNSNTPNSTSKKCQSPVTKATGKVEQSSPAKANALAAKPSGISQPKASSSDSEEEAPATAVQPAGTQQKLEVKNQSESSSKESSDDEHEASQSLLTEFNPRTIQASSAAKGASSTFSKQSLPAIGAQAKTSGKTAPAESTTSTDSSSSDSETEETVKQKTEITTLPPSGRKGAPAKLGKVAAGTAQKKASLAKKTQSNGQAQGSSAARLPVSLSPLLKAHAAAVAFGSNKEAAPQILQRTQGDSHLSCVLEPKGTKEKPSKKRKVAVGDTVPGEPKGKKLKKGTGEEMLKKKKKKKKKAKSSGSIKSPKKKDGKEKKSDKKKKKNKNLGTLNADGPQKKKKKKKKTEKFEGAA